MKKRVVVGMSGGVDSSVAAYLLKEQGYEVIGLFMRNWQEKDECGHCTAEEDYEDVRRVAQKLDVPYYTVDFSAEYMDRVFKLFVEEYKRGRTPNPDVLCNKEIKFDAFYKFAREIEADFVATGHYCGIRTVGGVNYLLRAHDENKCQTYFLNQVSQSQLDGVLFPLGDIDKPRVREIASSLDLSTATKKDSTGICFIGEKRFREFLSQYIPMKEGDIKTLDGEVVGRHLGVYFYTIGQRRGLGIGGDTEGDRWFVIDKDVKRNILYVNKGECDRLYCATLTTSGFNFISYIPTVDGTAIGGKAKDIIDTLRRNISLAQQELVSTEMIAEFKCLARIRHRQPLVATTARVYVDRVELIFDEAIKGVAEGQYAVIYDFNGVCLGGGQIVSRTHR